MTIGFGHMEVIGVHDKGYFSKAVGKEILVEWVQREWKERMYRQIVMDFFFFARRSLTGWLWSTGRLFKDKRYYSMFVCWGGKSKRERKADHGRGEKGSDLVHYEKGGLRENHRINIMIIIHYNRWEGRVNGCWHSWVRRFAGRTCERGYFHPNVPKTPDT